MKLDLINTPKAKSKVLFPLLVEQKVTVNNELAKLRHKKVISKANIKDKNTFLTGAFTRLKKDDSKRMVLNLKRLSKFIGYKHFKIKSLQNVSKCIKIYGIY